MKYGLIIGILVVGLLVAGGFWWFQDTSIVEETSAAPANAKVVVMVKRTGVYQLSGDQRVRLFTDDEISSGSTIVTDETGRAELRFPNGSIARLDSNTTLTLESSIIDDASGTTNTSLFLKIGRVWSRVASLATPASSWEVKTSNIVAAVRGTAFNVGVTKDGKHRLLVDEDTVVMKTVNPETGGVVAEAEVTEKKFAEIDSTSEEALAPKIEIVVPPKDIVEDIWVKENQTEDQAVEEELKEKEELFEKRAEAFEAELKIKKVAPEEYFEELKREAIKLKDTVASTPSLEEQLKTGEVGEVKSVPSQAEPSSGGGSAANVKIKTLKLKAQNAEVAYFENTDVLFSLVAVFSDGSEKDVTGEATWSVSGPIGSIGKPGVLRTQITDLFVAETGKADGAVIASFGGIETRASVIVLPPPLDETPNDRG